MNAKTAASLELIIDTLIALSAATVAISKELMRAAMKLREIKNELAEGVG